MKKIFLSMLVIGLLMSKQALADSSKTIYNAKFDGKNFSIQDDGSYLIDNKKAGSFIYDDSFLLHVYKSDKKNMLAVNVASEGSSKSIYWNLINLTDGKNFKIISNPNGLFEINGRNITVSTKKNDCTGTQNMDSDYPTGSYKNKYIAPTFVGFKKDGKTIYQPSNPNMSEVFCVRDCIKECIWIPNFYLSFEGLDKNLNNVYFSGQGYSTQGKNWTAYYAYDIKLNKITKTTLAKINKNKIKLSVVKDMGSKTSFKSSYFALSFDLPTGFEVKEDKDHISVYKVPYATREIRGDNTFFNLTRYDRTNTQATKMVYYDELLSDQKKSKIVIDGSTFTVLEGNGSSSFEGYNPGRVMAVFFDASWLEIIERPMDEKQAFDPMIIGEQILSSFKLSK